MDCAINMYGYVNIAYIVQVSVCPVVSKYERAASEEGTVIMAYNSVIKHY